MILPKEVLGQEEEEEEQERGAGSGDIRAMGTSWRLGTSQLKLLSSKKMNPVAGSFPVTTARNYLREGGT